jgi:putative ABC transport system substrate-binding protein
MMRRREFIAGLGGAAAWPMAVRAQQQPVIGILGGESPAMEGWRVAAIREGLQQAGFTEGRNLAIEYRWAEGQSDRLPALAADLVRRQVSVIVALSGVGSALAAKGATTTIPVIFITGSDPVKLGLVASLNRPGGNVTGVTSMSVEIGGKQLALLHELVPKAERFAVLSNPTSPALASAIIKEVQAAASAIGGQIEVLTASTNREIDIAFATLVQKRADALLISPSPLFAGRRVQITSLATRHAVPTIYYDRRFAEAGGLMSYGTEIADQVRQVGVYAARILKGEKPFELPVMRATKFEFVINLQMARTLGLEVPPSLLAIADEVIE